ncbi:MAG: hydroxyethylthiazole kinase [Rhizobiaceae bacterium]|nr:hydroxyethylthiazole kinase [Rhizobiaceae bacterium]MCV0408395.1 hydroxyethylthiazole kinase [Rhizobiaceae bacterium]
MNERLPIAATAADLLARIRRERPHVHCLTNTVVQKFTADGLSALGAFPSMTANIKEMGEFAGRADALLVNLGTLDAQRRQVIKAAIPVMNRRDRPWVLDPVKCHLSSPRLAFAQSLLRLEPAAIRGNSAETAALGFPPDIVVVETGERDHIGSGGETIAVLNGHPYMAAVTGTGCLSGAALAAFLAVGRRQPFWAAACAFLVIGVAAEMAAEHARGPGTFEPAYLDALAAIDADDLTARGRVEHGRP